MILWHIEFCSIFSHFQNCTELSEGMYQLDHGTICTSCYLVGCWTSHKRGVCGTHLATFEAHNEAHRACPGTATLVPDLVFLAVYYVMNVYFVYVFDEWLIMRLHV